MGNVPAHSRSSYHSAGFTLVELLVVIGIIALLMAILLPSLSKARKNAVQVQCLSQVRQLGIALLNYTQENRGRGPAQANGNMIYDFANPAVYNVPGNENIWVSLFPYLSDNK